MCVCVRSDVCTDTRRHEAMLLTNADIFNQAGFYFRPSEKGLKQSTQQRLGVFIFKPFTTQTQTQTNTNKKTRTHTEREKQRQRQRQRQRGNQKKIP